MVPETVGNRGLEGGFVCAVGFTAATLLGFAGGGTRLVWFPLFELPLLSKGGPAFGGFMFKFGSLIFSDSLNAKQKSPILRISPFFPEYSVKQFRQ